MQVSRMLRKPKGREHIWGNGGFHRRHRLLQAGVISYPASPLEVSDSCPISRQPAQLLHSGTTVHQHIHTSHIKPNLDPLKHLSLLSQASSYREVGQVTGDGLIKGHAYAITDTEKASITQSGACRLRSTNLLALVLARFLKNDQFLHKTAEIQSQSMKSHLLLYSV